MSGVFVRKVVPADQLGRTITRIAHEILEKKQDRGTNMPFSIDEKTM